MEWLRWVQDPPAWVAGQDVCQCDNTQAVVPTAVPFWPRGGVGPGQLPSVSLAPLVQAWYCALRCTSCGGLAAYTSTGPALFHLRHIHPTQLLWDLKTGHVLEC